MSEPVISVTDLTRRYGDKMALAAVNLSVPRGVVYGLVGANGAGKTTLIKHILGLRQAQSGSVRVFDLDPVADPVGVLSRIGYLSEHLDLPGWMSVAELVRYSRAFYPAWDDAYAEELRVSFALNPSTKIKNLSKGQRARAGLLVALAYRPELLLLDEPSSGLDPIVRRDILAAVIRTIADEGRTVFFSSHLLDEVEQVADYVTMIRLGQIVLSAPLSEIKQSYRFVHVHFAESRSEPPAIACVLRWEGCGKDWTAVVHGANELPAAVAEWEASIVTERAATLNEIFVGHAGVPAVENIPAEAATAAT